ncbi:hypothetical protein DNC80_01340 [Flavobacterium sp. SOK18b]|uniref:DUF6265 family protein n=1 Tax=Flavobacterium sp. SOK18b TaxID=797900 RepID=UPI0015FC0533|nr:DUF6265 family protein [Flavobacterium sp. SOK18b]MBB1192308.1 hypothetical protein [Flavobacterium sp. SOK18b]
MKKSALIILSVICIFSCNKNKTSEKEKIKAAQWIIGNWKYKTATGILTENWTKGNDSTLLGTSFYIQDKDTIHHETIVLQQNGDNLTYTATIKGQHNDQPVIFTLNNATEKTMVFENLKNDYPRTITYQQVSSQSIIAKISGIQQGKPSSEQFVLKK